MRNIGKILWEIFGKYYEKYWGNVVRNIGELLWEILGKYCEKYWESIVRNIWEILWEKLGKYCEKCWRNIVRKSCPPPDPWITGKAPVRSQEAHCRHIIFAPHPKLKFNEHEIKIGPFSFLSIWVARIAFFTMSCAGLRWVRWPNRLTCNS